jgi:hypothetical protein
LLVFSNMQCRAFFAVLGLPLWVASIGVFCVSGCAGSEMTIAPTPRRIELPQSGELEVRAEALAPVGNVLPVKVTVKNVAPRARTFQQPGVWGITASGERIQELPLDAPAVVANGDGLLQEVSCGESAMSETFRTNWDAPWGLLVAAGPMAWTAFAVQTAMTSASSPSERLADYRLRLPRSSGSVVGKPSLQQGIEYVGYAFLPDRHYAAIELAVLNILSGNEEFIAVPLAFVTPTAHE